VIRVLSFLSVLSLFCSAAFSQTDYRLPPEPIARMMQSSAAPWFQVSPDQKSALLMHRAAMPSIEEIAVDAVEVAGLRIHPKTNGEAASRFIDDLSLVNLQTLAQSALLPSDVEWRILRTRWSPDSKQLAFTNVREDGIDLWVLSLAKPELKLVAEGLNEALSKSFQWVNENQLLVLKVLEGRGAAPVAGVPAGPVVEQSSGEVAAVRTFQNLLKTAHDEALFEYYLNAELHLLSLDSGADQVLTQGLVSSFSLSPDRRLLIVSRLHRPWSRQVAYWRFPTQTVVRNLATAEESVIHDAPLMEAVSISYDSRAPGPRGINWRRDLPATLYWVEAMDGGCADSTAQVRDAVFLLHEPFEGEAQILTSLEYRARGPYWCDAHTAILYERWHRDRLERLWLLDPTTGERRLLNERASDDAYAETGSPLFEKNDFGSWVLRKSADKTSLFFSGRGASERGVFPFLDQWNLETGERVRLWESSDPYYERLEELLEGDGERFVLRRQSATDAPNYFLLENSAASVKVAAANLPLHTEDFEMRQITHNPDPAPELAGLQKEVLEYKRADGVDLSGTLYLPPNYRRGVDAPLPTLLWVYPREFRDRKSAGRVTSSENTFSRPSGSSVLYLLTQGIAVFSGVSIPILGENDEQPNDTYIEQLIMGAEAAVACLVDAGVSDPERLAVGGHSYGAFTAANLVAHTDLFKTAICRSGAYNRSLTPFSFQGEERNFWDAQQTYLKMSPFMQAQLIDEPVLLIHGVEDSNSGTYPMQSERFYAALKGLGVQARLVMLPGEGHGCKARESIGHVLWEMCDWLDRYLVQDPLPVSPTEQ
jgi:dipeptidyl aminopeptidase/acylaminoacyl peptidase